MAEARGGRACLAGPLGLHIPFALRRSPLRRVLLLALVLRMLLALRCRVRVTCLRPSAQRLRSSTASRLTTRYLVGITVSIVVGCIIYVIVRRWGDWRCLRRVGGNSRRRRRRGRADAPRGVVAARRRGAIRLVAVGRLLLLLLAAEGHWGGALLLLGGDDGRRAVRWDAVVGRCGSRRALKGGGGLATSLRGAAGGRGVGNRRHHRVGRAIAGNAIVRRCAARRRRRAAKLMLLLPSIANAAAACGGGGHGGRAVCGDAVIRRCGAGGALEVLLLGRLNRRLAAAVRIVALVGRYGGVASAKEGAGAAAAVLWLGRRCAAERRERARARGVGGVVRGRTVAANAKSAAV